MTTLVFLLEEPSARELLRGLLPHVVGTEVAIHYLVFEGKQDLEKNVTRKLRGWRAPDSRFVVLRDQDAGDCHKIKSGLVARVTDSGRNALVRVACRELESWIAGDLAAVATAFERPNVAGQATKEKFRTPDMLVRPVEALRELVPDYQKVDGARRVGPLLDPQRNTSKSFLAFCAGVRRVVEEDAVR